MPIVPCRECGARVSSFAPKCPHCGYPFARPPSVPGTMVIASGVFLGMLLFSILAAIAGFFLSVLFAGMIAGATGAGT
jgi:hypothetical protein